MADANAVVARLTGASKRYGKQVALHGIDLQVRRGELLALLGPNGAGKTTAISLLLGLSRADGGEVRLFDADPQAIEPRRRIGVMLQSAALQGTLRVGELLALTGSYYPNPITVAEAAALAGIGDLLKRPYAGLSGGQQRRVQFAMAVSGRPELLFLDEPTVGMDLQARQQLWRTVRALVDGGAAIVLTTHYLEEAEALADRVVVMTHGRIVSEGSVDELRARVSRKHVRCITSTSPDIVAGWDGVDTAHTEQGRLVVTTADAESVVRRLLAGDATLHELEVQRAGLAEAFTELTRDDEATQEAA